MTTTSIHPDVVYNAMLEAGGHPSKIKNLKLVHDACRRQNERHSRDFSFKTIGRFTEEQGGLGWRSIYNTAAYKKLIEAWQAYSGPAEAAPRQHKAPPVVEKYLANIEDPAVRSIMEGVIIERDKLRGENNLLRTLPRGIIDKRPLGATVAFTEDAKSVAVLTLNAQLTESERTALRKAVSKEVMEHNGWTEGSHGQVVTSSGRTIFEVGFTTSIRKMLAEE